MNRPTPAPPSPAADDPGPPPLEPGPWSWLSGWRSFITADTDGALVRRNVAWLMGDRALRLVVGLAVNVALVRYLGAANLGLMSFGQSVVVVFAVLSNLGLETILVRDLVRNPADSQRLLGTAYGLRAMGLIATLAASLAAVTLLRPGDALARTVTMIFVVQAAAQTLDVLDCWFQSQSRIATLVRARAGAFLAGTAAKVVAIVLHASLPVVAAIVAGEFALAALALLVAYGLEGGRLAAWRFEAAKARELLRDSWPLMVNGIAIVASVRVDQMLVTTLRGTTENGVYAAAQRLTEVIYFVPVAVMTAANPVLLRWHTRDPAEHRRRLARVFRVLGLLGLGIAVSISLVANPLALLLFGPQFRASGPVLAILVWACPALFLGVAQTNWFIAEGRQRGLMARSVVAAVIGLALNAWLVPGLGARGAAIAMVASQTFAHFALNALFRSTRGLFAMQIRALLPWTRA